MDHLGKTRLRHLTMLPEGEPGRSRLEAAHHTVGARARERVRRSIAG